MLADDEAWKVFHASDLIYSAEEVNCAVQRLAGEIGTELAGQYPLILCVMGGAVIFTGQLLPLLNFPLEFDYVQVSRYGDTIRGGQSVWKVPPPASVKGRTVLILDDILDEGVTMAEILSSVRELGARSCYVGVFADKAHGRPKPVKPNFVGLKVPDRYVFGFGMDVRGLWRNLPAIYALKD